MLFVLCFACAPAFAELCFRVCSRLFAPAISPFSFLRPRGVWVHGARRGTLLRRHSGVLPAGGWSTGTGGCCQGRRCAATRSRQKRAAPPRSAGGGARSRLGPAHTPAHGPGQPLPGRPLTAETARLALDRETEPAVVAALGLGRLIALRKPSGRVRGIVVSDAVSDFSRRLVARTLAQQHAAAFQEACHPHQFALATRAGADCLVHALTAAVELDPEATVLSVDGAGALDSVSRQSMMGRARSESLPSFCAPVLRFAFGVCVARCGWSTHTVTQAEGGEQGARSCPPSVLAEVQARLAPSELLLAFFDDVYLIARPDRIRPIFDMLLDALWRHAHIRLIERVSLPLRHGCRLCCSLVGVPVLCGSAVLRRVFL